jgi:thermitase
VLDDRKMRAVMAMLTLLAFVAAGGGLATSERPVVAQGPEPLPGAASSGELFEPGRILVKFSEGVSAAAAESTLQQFDATYVSTLYDSSVQLWEVPEGSELSTAERLNADPTVEYAEPNYRFYAFDRVPNDPRFNRQWAHTIMHSPGAWDITTGCTGVTIAIIDTGIDEAHPDLAGKLVAGWDYVDGDSNPHDLNGHGTHVAGIAAAMTNNGVGVAGMDWSARIMPIRVLDNQGNGYADDVANGIRWAFNHGARVLNLSLGGPSGSATLQGAVNDAYAAGRLVVAAMGNEGSATPMYPAKYDYVLAVAATGPSDIRASYSNYGAHCDVAAPGGSMTYYHDTTGIYSTMPTYPVYMTTQYSYYTNYDYVQGTSQATPYVSGLAALVWARQPFLTPDQVQGTIQNTATDLGAPGWDAYYGYGRIDTLAALQAYLPSVAPVLSVISNADGDGTYLVDWSDVPYATSYTLEEDDTASFSTPITRYSGSNSQYQVTAQPGGVWYYRARADQNCGSSSWSNVRSVGVRPGPPSLNLNPVAQDAYTLSWSTATGATGYTLEEDDNASFSSPDVRYRGSALQYNVTGQPGGTWYYRVRAYNSAGDGPWSSSRSTTVPPPALPAPNLYPIDNADGDGQFLVDWTDVPATTSYVLEQSRDPYFSTPSIVYSGAASQFQVVGQSRGRWHYRVRAFGSSGQSPWSNSQSAVVPFRVDLPLVVKAYVQTELANGTFEAGSTAWTEFSSQGYAVIVQSGFPAGVTPHSGQWAAWLGRVPDEVSYIQQSLTIPASSPYLHYWHWISSETDVCDLDLASVRVSGTPVEIYGLCRSADTGGWQEHSVDLGAYAGQSITLRFQVDIGSATFSSLFVDDISFQASAAASQLQ